MQIDYHIFRRFYDELLEANDERSVLRSCIPLTLRPHQAQDQRPTSANHPDAA
jgi:hypothetical protein